MNYFLKEARREELNNDLVELSMPSAFANTITNRHFSEDNLVSLENFLLQRVEMTLKWAKDLADAMGEDNEQDAAMYNMYLIADMLTLSAYSDECRERGLLSKEKMPRFYAAIASGVDTSTKIKEYALKKVKEANEKPATRH